jgi:rhodanese-related sulfurtransferase
MVMRMLLPLALIAASLDVWAADISAEELRAARARPETAVYVLDVRTPEEYAAGHVPGAVNIAIGTLDERVSEVPKDRLIVVYCEKGSRAARAEKLLSANGREVRHLAGDMSGWRAAKLEVER